MILFMASMMLGKNVIESIESSVRISVDHSASGGVTDDVWCNIWHSVWDNDYALAGDILRWSIYETVEDFND